MVLGVSWALSGVSLGWRGSSACGVGVWGVAFVAARGAVIPWVCSWARSGSVPSRWWGRGAWARAAGARGVDVGAARRLCVAVLARGVRRRGGAAVARVSLLPAHRLY